MPVEPLDLSKLKVFPLSQRQSLTRADEILIDPDSTAKPCSTRIAPMIQACARDILAARQRGAAVMLIYGAHLLRNGAATILERMMRQQWLTHLATNGAGTIHDWEYAWFGASTESVEMNVNNGTFGTWHPASHMSRAPPGPPPGGATRESRTSNGTTACRTPRCSTV